MSPRYLRYRFPSDDSPAAVLPTEAARALARRFLAVPAHELSIGRLDAEALEAAREDADPGALDYAHGDAAGEELAPWLRLVVGIGGRTAWLDVDVEELGRTASAAQIERGW